MDGQPAGPSRDGSTIQRRIHRRDKGRTQNPKRQQIRWRLLSIFIRLLQRTKPPLKPGWRCLVHLACRQRASTPSERRCATRVFYKSNALYGLKIPWSWDVQDYQWKHEPCLYGWKAGAAHLFYGRPDKHNRHRRQNRPEKIKKEGITRAFNGHLKRKNAQHNNQLRQTNAISGASNNETNFIIGATDKKIHPDQTKSWLTVS